MKSAAMCSGLPTLGRDAVRLILLAVAAGIAGVLWGLLDSRLALPTSGAEDGRVVRLADLQGPGTSGWVVVDARDPMLYRMGHIPGSINLPARMLGEMDGETVKTLIPPELWTTPVLVYCSEAGCEDSHRVAERLRSVGLAGVYVLVEGWKGWLESGGEVTTP